MREIIIDPEKCTGCGVCVSSCLYDALSIDDGRAVCNRDICALCGACGEVCPAEALSINESAAEMAAPDNCRDIWVFAEQWQGRIHDAVFELLSAGRGLAADLGEDLCAVLIGSDVNNAEELISCGAKKVYYLKDASLGIPEEDTVSRLLTKLILDKKPEIVLYAATPFGRSMAPRVAAALKTGLTADCTQLAIDPAKRLLLQTRPAFGGNVMATILCRTKRPQMATVRPRVFKKTLPEAAADGEIVMMPAKIDQEEIKSRILEVAETAGKTLRVEDAQIVVAGGAGFASADEFDLVRQLADALGGCVGASRAAVELGFAGYDAQIGQTGKVIAPKLYIACGISGAIQHMIGMEHADYIVAINRDPDAAIFQIADVCIVGDVKAVLPELIEEVRAAKTKKEVFTGGNDNENRNM